MRGVSHAESPANDMGAGFTTTRWTVVLAAGNKDHVGAAALSELCRCYWPPLYAFVRRSGYSPHDAQDLTQAFFARFLEKDYLADVQPERGRFRSFLLGSLKHFLANEWDRQRAQRRGGTSSIISGDIAELEYAAQLQGPAAWNPERIYARAWALTLIDAVMVRLQEECARAGKGVLFDTLKPWISGEKAAESYTEVGQRLNMTPGSVQVAVHRLRRRYGEALRDAIRNTVERPEDVDEEIRYLFSVLQE